MEDNVNVRFSQRRRAKTIDLENATLKELHSIEKKFCIFVRNVIELRGNIHTSLALIVVRSPCMYILWSRDHLFGPYFWSRKMEIGSIPFSLFVFVITPNCFDVARGMPHVAA